MPATIPIMNTRAKSWMILAPKIKRARAARKVVALVRIVRERVRFTAILMMSASLAVGLRTSSSRIRSKTTMVSLIE